MSHRCRCLVTCRGSLRCSAWCSGGTVGGLGRHICHLRRPYCAEATLKSEPSLLKRFYNSMDRLALLDRLGDGATLCPGRKPPFWTVKRPARPYKIAIQNRFTVENAKGAEGLPAVSRIFQFFLSGVYYRGFRKARPRPQKRPPQRVPGCVGKTPEIIVRPCRVGVSSHDQQVAMTNNFHILYNDYDI